jgi:hypothetical protein
MAKRLTREEKWNQAVIDLINEMFKIAGHNVTYDDIKDRKDNWFNDWTITELQYDEWLSWGSKYIQNKLKINIKQAKKEMSWVGLMWGLKFDSSIFTQHSPNKVSE